MQAQIDCVITCLSPPRWKMREDTLEAIGDGCSRIARFRSNQPPSIRRLAPFIDPLATIHKQSGSERTMVRIRNADACHRFDS